MTTTYIRRRLPRIVNRLLFLAAAFAAAASGVAPAHGGQGAANPIPPAFARLPIGTELGGRLSANETVSFALTLPIADPSGLATFLKRVYDPRDPLYGHYLSPSEFADRFGPSGQRYQALEQTAEASGLTIDKTYANRMVLDVHGSAAVVEHLSNVHLYHAVSPDGHVYHVADSSPSDSGALAAVGSTVVGLDDAPAARPHLERGNALTPHAGSPSGLSPDGIRQVYSIPVIAASGQSVALVEFDGYNPTDIQEYRSTFGLSGTPIRIISVDGATNTAGSNAGEVVLDIDMELALNRDGAGLLVYEGPNSEQGGLDTYATIASNDLAKVVSTSWGLPESQQPSSEITSESQSFEEMAAQGQSVLAASGDNGAYDDGRSLSVDDPASQPMVTGIGGTTLTTTSNGNYESETTWNSGASDASGGGVSAIWPMPSYQVAASLAGSMRLVPDIATDADPSTGYAVYFSDPKNGTGWYLFGGTSAGPPLWSGIFAMVNQQRVAHGLATIGLANQAIYDLAKNRATYASDFHDVTTGNNNYYSAGVGYDETTGWGSFVGTALIDGLSNLPDLPAAPTPTISPNGGSFTSVQSVTITDSVSAAIYYTTDGSTPTPNSTLYSGPITVSANETINAIAVAGGYSNSAVASAAFTINLPPAPAPTISPSGGTFTSVQSVTMSDPLSGASIYYTTNGSTPTTGSLLYGDAITVSASETINAIAVAPGYSASAIASAAFTLNLPASFSAGLQMISLPYSYPGVGLDSLFGYSGVVLAVWDQATDSYAVTPTPPANQILLGQGYWVRFPQEAIVSEFGTPAPANVPYDVPLQAGWNMVGDPFTTIAPLSSLTFNGGTESFSQATAGSPPLIGSTVWSYDTATQAYTSVTSLDPNIGYWVFAYGATDMDFPPQ